MTLTGVSFYIFLPICILIYYILPAKVRYIWLLFCSYFFYCSLDGAFASLLIFSTAITWLTGNAIASFNNTTARKCIMALGIIINVSMLLIYKYENFFLDLIGSKTVLNLILPAGISFYTFQSLTYIIDIYRDEVEPEKNIFRYALFVSFFPLILSGPIERAKHLIPQLNFDVKFNTQTAKDGLKFMLYGYFLKIVIVARMSILTDYVFSDYLNKTSVALLIAVVAYAIQIYCDFAGYSAIAIGMCQIMGIDIIKNFRQPYFAVSIADFWRRWHISLSTWFRDYLYIPLGGNRKGKIRKYINIMVVFIVSGLWHGANMTFVVWGFLNGAFQVIGDILKPLRSWISCKIKLNKKPNLSRRLSVIFTFILICFTWIFFRASSIYEAIEIIRRIASSFSYVNLIDGTIWNVGLGVNNMLFAIIAILILFLSDIICEKNNSDISGIMNNTKSPIRWSVYYIMIIMIILSMNLNMTEFIYSAF